LQFLTIYTKEFVMFASVQAEKAFDFRIVSARETDRALGSPLPFFEHLVVQPRRIEGILDRNETLRNWGYTPIKSTASGAFRVTKSVFLTFYDVIIIPTTTVSSARDQLKAGNTKGAFAELLIRTPKWLLSSLSVNVADTARGIIEMVPVAGNLAAWGFDQLSYKYREWQNGILSEEELQTARIAGRIAAFEILREQGRTPSIETGITTEEIPRTS